MRNVKKWSEGNFGVTASRLALIHTFHMDKQSGRRGEYVTARWQVSGNALYRCTALSVMV
jgi:hypothetical protein